MSKRLLAVIFIVSLTAFSALPAFAKGQDIIKINADIDIPEDMVAGDVIAIAGNVTVSGKVENNVVAVGGSVILKPHAYVGEQVVAVGGSIVKDPSVKIDGRMTQVYMPHFIPSCMTLLKGGWIALWATVSVLVLLGFLGLAILMAALIPDNVKAAVNAVERSFIVMFLWGVLWLLLIFPIAVLLAVSIIGIVLIPLEVLIVVLALIIGYVTSAVFIGKNVVLSFKKTPPPFVDAILGILILFFIGFIPVLGPMLKAIFIITGFGAVMTTRFGTMK